MAPPDSSRGAHANAYTHTHTEICCVTIPNCLCNSTPGCSKKSLKSRDSLSVNAVFQCFQLIQFMGSFYCYSIGSPVFCKQKRTKMAMQLPYIGILAALCWMGGNYSDKGHSSRKNSIKHSIKVKVFIYFLQNQFVMFCSTRTDFPVSLSAIECTEWLHL